MKRIVLFLTIVFLASVGCAAQQEQRTQATNVTQLKVWKTIKLGTGLKTGDDFRVALKNAGFEFDLYTEHMLDNVAFTVAVEETEVELVIASVADLGFKNGATREEIYDRALELGLTLCPAEVGPKLSLEYTDQPMDEMLQIAMEPIASLGGSLRVFVVVRGDFGRWLLNNNDVRDFHWHTGVRWVFVRRK